MTIPSKANLEPRLARLERMEAIEGLVRRIGHDFNNLFGIVIGAMGVLRAEISEKPELGELRPFINDAESAGREGAQLMARLLACVGNQVLQASVVKPNELIARIIERLNLSLEQNVRLESALVPNLPSVNVDPGKLESAIESMIDNALEAMPGGGTLRITSQARLRDDIATAGQGSTDWFVGISVSDSGEGIAPDILKCVVEPFFTTRQGAKNRGLGLSLAYGYALQSGGTLCIDSNAEHGITATLWLPVAAGNDVTNETQPGGTA